MKEDNSGMIHEFAQEQPVNICMRDLQKTRVVNDARVAHTESRAYTENTFLRYFWAFSDFGVFWKVLANWNKFLTAQKMRSNGVTELKIWVLQDRCFFSDFQEVPTCDEIMEKWSQAEMWPQPVKHFNRYLTYGIQTINQMNSPYQTITSWLGTFIGENPYFCYLVFSSPQHLGEVILLK